MPSRGQLLDAYELPGGAGRHLRVNFVASADGAVTLSGHSGGLGGATDRLLLHVLRIMADALVVGAGTVRAEGYGGLGLTPEDVAWRRARSLPDAPALAVVSNRLDLAPDSPVFHRPDGRTMVLTHDAAPAGRMAELAEVADVVVCGRGAVDVTAALDALAARGLTHVLSEGGPHLFGAMLTADLVDEVCLTVSPRFVAGTAHRIAASPEQLERRFRPGPPLVDDEGFVFLRYHRAGSTA